jgi:lipid-A-disaccharide synthase-like uncharacterized protein
MFSTYGTILYTLYINLYPCDFQGFLNTSMIHSRDVLLNIFTRMHNHIYYVVFSIQRSSGKFSSWDVLPCFSGSREVLVYFLTRRCNQFFHVVFQGPEKFWYIFLLGGVIMFFHVVFKGPEKFWYIFLLGGVIMFFFMVQRSSGIFSY